MLIVVGQIRVRKFKQYVVELAVDRGTLQLHVFATSAAEKGSRLANRLFSSPSVRASLFLILILSYFITPIIFDKNQESRVPPICSLHHSPRRPKHHPHHPILKHPQPIF